MNDQQQLLEKYVAAFSKLDDMDADELLSPIAWHLAVGVSDEHGFKRWEPLKIETAPSLLERIYAKLPARFPRLFESMVLSYRWAEVDLGSYWLLANPPGPDLSGLQDEISSDQALWNVLFPAGFIQFGRGTDIDYDPVCFDTKTRRHGGDCRIVKIDHEEILCNSRVKVVAELASSFQELVEQTIERAGV